MRVFYRAVLSVTLLLFTIISEAQEIKINAEDYRQQYQGGGVSFGLYVGHHWSMSEENQDSIIKLMFRDVNMEYVQSYEGLRPVNDANSYEGLAKYVKHIRRYRPGVKLSVVLNKFPEDLTKTVIINGKKKNPIDTDIPGVYDKLAENFLDIMKKMHTEGVDIDFFNMVNEPDFQKNYYYGYNNAKKGVGLIIQKSIPKLKEMLKDPVLNPDGLKCPVIIAPSTIGPGGCRSFINEWKTNYKTAWENVDVVGTHQYVGGDNWDAFSSINKNLEGRGFLQTEQHTNKGDGLGSLTVNGEKISSIARSPLSLASMFSTAVNNGVESWFYFVVNYPNTYHNGGLFQVSWAGKPIPYKTYYAFKQLHNIQEMDAHNISRTLSNVDGVKATMFRSRNDSLMVAHISNNTEDAKSIDLIVKGLSENYKITGYKAWQTDSVKNMEKVAEEVFGTEKDTLKYEFPPFSLTSIELACITPDIPYIEFDPITDKQYNDADFALKATSSNGTPVTFTIEGGEAEIVNGDSVRIKGLGEVTIKASHAGAADVYKSFSIRGDYIRNAALNKTATAKSEDSGYPAANATDGNISSNSSRWLTKAGEGFPTWLEVDLGAVDSIIGVQFYTGYDSYKDAPSDFTIESWDGSKWTPFITETGNTDALYQKTVPMVKTDKVRLNITNGVTDRIKLFEFELLSVTTYIDSAKISSANDSYEITEDKGTLQFNSMVYPENASFRELAWRVDNEALASIDQNGILTAIADGTVKVIGMARDNSGASDTMTVTISNQTTWVKSIAIAGEGGASSIVENETLQLTASILPADATDKTITWSVESVTGTATISESGLLTAGTPGKVTVKATANGPSGTVGELEIEIVKASGLTASQSSSVIKCYPNPARDILNIKSQKDGMVSILNMVGQQVYSDKLNANEEISFNTESLPRGQYVIRFLSDDVKTYILILE